MTDNELIVTRDELYDESANAIDAPELDLLPVAIKISLKSLAEIAEKSPGYTVTEARGYIVQNIRYRRTASGRRDRAYVLAEVTMIPKTTLTETFDSTQVISIQD